MGNTKSFSKRFAAASILSLAGCSAAPSVEYKDFSSQSPDYDGYSKFTLQASAIRAKTTVQNPADLAARSLQITVESVPSATPNARYGIRDSGSDWWLKTEAKLKTRENSDLVEKLDIELFDNRKETIEKVGGALASVVAYAPDEPLDAAKAGGDEATLVFDLASKMEAAPASAFELKVSAVTDNEKYKGWAAKIAINAIPNDAIKRSEFDLGKASGLYFYSACRDTLVEILDEKGKVRAKNALRISDPTHLQTIALPTKGTVTMDSQCGVGVTREPKELTKDTELLNTIIQQVKAILDAKKGDAS